MNKSVIVYGPQGCGKTRNAELLMKHYGLSEIVELDEPPVRLSRCRVGCLILTSQTREQLLDRKMIDPEDRRVFSFEEAMNAVAAADSSAWFAREIDQPIVQNTLRDATNQLVGFCHGASVKAGWWGGDIYGLTPLEHVRQNTRVGKALVAEKLCLTHSEISEAMEGHRKGLMDDKLPHHPMTAVELGDALIRICDLAGAQGYDLGTIVAEKMAFNAVRPDHKKEAREAVGGKAY